VSSQQLRQRYERLDRSRQLGNLASTLARISSRVTDSRHDALVADLLREAAVFIEWSAKQVSADSVADLAALQRELLAWRRVWPLDQARSLIALYTRNASDRLLRMAGLVSPTPVQATTLKEQQTVYSNARKYEPEQASESEEDQ
jgi:hypothetical protein